MYVIHLVLSTGLELTSPRSAWRHFGCAEPTLIEKMKASYGSADEVDGFADLQENEKEKVQRAWDAGEIPADDKGPGEAVETGKKKAAVPRKKKDEDGAEKPKRGRKPKVCCRFCIRPALSSSSI